MRNVRVVERVVQLLLGSCVALCVGACGGGTARSEPPQQELDVAGEMDLLHACAMESLAAIGELERVFSGERRATTTWLSDEGERVRYASHVYLHPRFGPALTVEPFRQRWLGDPSTLTNEAPVHRVEPEPGVRGWLPTEFREADRDVSERAVFRASECWRQRRSAGN